jgi:hypothetical protein
MTTLSHSAWGQIDMTEAARFFGPLIGYENPNFQVRVEQRIIIRVPRQTSSPAGLGVPGGSARSTPARFKEEKIGKCLVMDRLVGLRSGPKESLELITRDGVLIRAYLGDGCLAREFYAGAYMERPLDGKLCVERDILHARTGAKCEVDKFRLLVPQ